MSDEEQRPNLAVIAAMLSAWAYALEGAQYSRPPLVEREDGLYEPVDVPAELRWAADHLEAWHALFMTPIPPAEVEQQESEPTAAGPIVAPEGMAWHRN